MKKILIVIILYNWNNILIGQVQSKVIDPWENQTTKFKSFEEKSSPKFVSSPIDYFYKDLISFYQSKISTKSIQRCPFYISCSHYTKKAITRYGSFIGLLLFIDRNLFRENTGMTHYYTLRRKSHTFKLDDSYYLFQDQ